MNNFKKFFQMSIVMFAIMIITSACGSKSEVPNYFLFYQLDNAKNTITVKINDSLEQDKIASADFYYRQTTDKGKLSKSIKQENDQLVNNVEPKEKNTFDVPVPDDINAQNIKIVAIITYDNKKNILDYWSSYDGVEAENDSFSIDFQSSKDVDGFGGGNGTEDNPYIISQPRHFASINAQDDEGNYINYDKHFKQTENIDLSNLTGFKIDRTEDDKDITVEKINPWAPFYNEGHGVPAIGVVAQSSSSQMPGIGGSQNNEEDSHKTYFKGTYDGNNLIIDGIHIINSNEPNIALFTGTYSATLKNIILGENSIVLIDGISGVDKLNISALSSSIINTIIENCTNNSKIIVKNVKNVKSIIVSGISTDIKTESENSSSTPSFGTNTNNNNNENDNNENNNTEESEEEEISYEYTNCVNKANICIYNNNIEKIYVGGCFTLSTMSMDSMDMSSMTSMFGGSDITISKCKNSGSIKITKNKTSKAKGAIVASGVHVNIFSMDMGSMGDMSGSGQDNNNNNNNSGN